MYNAIEWMTQVTGREYNDEKLCKAVENEIDSTALWAGIMACNRNIHAPIDHKLVYSFCNSTINRREKDETVELNKILMDEMKDRVANQIAAVPTERFRVMDDSQPPWHTLRIFHTSMKYGCVT